MKNTCRRNGYISLVALVVMMLLLVSSLTACGNPNQVSGRYDLEVLEATPNFYVNDFAGVFSDEEIEKLMQQAVDLDKDYSGIQVVITTVESLDKTVLGYQYVVEDANGNRVDDPAYNHENKEPSRFTIEEVAYSMYSQYGIGQDDMGILVLFSTGDREVRIETGRAMQFYITDSLSGRILDKYGMDYFAEDKFAEGLVSVQTAVINEIKSQVSPDWAEKTEMQKESEADVVPEVNSQENYGEVQNVTNENSQKEESGNGLLWGVFGSIAAMFAAIGAFIRQHFKGKEEKETLEKAKQEEISLMKADFQTQLYKKDSEHEAAMSKLKTDYQRLVKVRDTTVQELNHEIALEREKFGTLKNEYDELTEKYSRVQRLHPEFNFDKEVQEMIENEYKTAAQEIDEKLSEVLKISATKDNYDIFNNALSLIDGSKNEVRKYITSSRSAIESLYNEAIRLKKEHEKAVQEEKDRKAANAAYEKIKDACDKNPIGSYKNFAALSTALALFTGLTAAQKQFFPDCKLISELERVHRTAENDFNNHEAARKAEANVDDIIGGMYSADEDDRDKLERAMRYYRNLSEIQKKYFSAELLNKLRKLITEAEEDHDRQERRRRQEADERRRAAAASRSSSSFSSSHRSSSSFSGRGGRPSGGGASRRF